MANNPVDRLLKLLTVVLSESSKHAAEFRFNKHHSLQLTVICVYCTIIELAHGEQALIEKGQTVALPVILRSIFEAYADLLSLIEDPDYEKSMYATFLHEKVRFLKNVLRNPSNPFFTGIRAGIDVNGEIERLGLEIAEFEKQGRRPLSNFSRFDSAEMGHEYQSIYWLLCLDGHNNLSALNDRHIEGGLEDFNVVLFKGLSAADLIRNFDALLAVLIDSGVRVHELLNTGLACHFKDCRRVFEECRADYVTG